MKSGYESSNPNVNRLNKLKAVGLAVGVLVSSMALTARPNKSLAAEKVAAGCWPYAQTGKYSRIDHARSISATITETRQPKVSSGHVAGWIGLMVGGKGIQAGIKRKAGDSQSRVYYEQTDPYGNRVFVKLLGGISVGRPVNFKIENIGSGYWSVWVNGHRQRPAVQIHDRLSPEFMAESSSQINDASPNCRPNSLEYEFRHLSAEPAWPTTEDPLQNLKFALGDGYQLHQGPGNDFSAGRR